MLLERRKMHLVNDMTTNSFFCEMEIAGFNSKFLPYVLLHKHELTLGYLLCCTCEKELI